MFLNPVQLFFFSLFRKHLGLLCEKNVQLHVTENAVFLV